MATDGRFGKYGEKKRIEKLKEQKKPPKRTSATYKLEENYKISPTHPGKGRK
jgi:hypothetical protein